MKFTLKWLAEHLDHNKPPLEIKDALIHLGIEVEEVKDYPKRLKEFSVGYIISAEKHPNADKLQVCKVDTKDGEQQIVCGANNARAGIYVIYAPCGAYIPGIDITLKKTSIRGVESNGMIVSQKELLISDEHEGIIELATGIVGEECSKALGLDDVVIEISLTPNRGDLLGIRGIAKDLSALGIGVLKPLDVSKISPSIKTDITLNIDTEISKKFLICKIDSIKNIDSPYWLKNRLLLIGQKSINALVDITNYVCFSLNQPLHVYDANKITNKELSVRFAPNNTKIMALDGKEYDLDNTIPIVAFDKQIGAMAGIKGALDSSCDKDTTSIYLEAAHFNNEIVALAKRKTSQNTESSYRFERGIDIPAIEHAFAFAQLLIKEICGGKFGDIVAYSNYTPKENIYISLSYINHLSGVIFTANEVEDILKRLDFTIVEKQGDNFVVTPPSRRNDIDIRDSVAYEVIRIHGINNLPQDPLICDITKTVKTIPEDYLRVISTKRDFANLGFLENISMSFISKKLVDIFNIYDEKITLHNPISEDLSVMRPSLIPSLLLGAQRNINNSYHNLKMCEVASIYSPSGQQNAAGAIITGLAKERDWRNIEEKCSVWHAKEIVISILGNMGLNIDNLTVLQDNLPSFYHPGRCGKIELGKGVTIAIFGEIHPSVKEAMGLKVNAVALEIFLDNIPQMKKKSTLKPEYRVSSLMPITRDFAFIVAKSVKAFEIIKLIKSVDKKYITSVDIFDIYDGDKIAQGKKSLALRVTLQAYEKTFIDEEIHNISNKIISIVVTTLDAQIRDK